MKIAFGTIFWKPASQLALLWPVPSACDHCYGSQNMFQMTFIPDYEMISAFSSNTAVESFNIGILPWASVSC